MEESLALDKVFEIAVVKHCWALEIKWCQIVVPCAIGPRAVGSPCLGKGTINVGLVVYAGPKRCASCLSNCVGSCILKAHYKD